MSLNFCECIKILEIRYHLQFDGAVYWRKSEADLKLSPKKIGHSGFTRRPFFHPTDGHGVTSYVVD